MQVERNSPCKINLILNILGQRPDGFHALETVMHPVAVFDRLTFSRSPGGIQLTCDHAELPTDAGNLVYRAAAQFLETAHISDGVKIHLEKRIPLAAGLGGGSGNAATTLTGLNQLFGLPLSDSDLVRMAANLGSDIPFFLQDRPAIALGRGEQVFPLEPFSGLSGIYVLLIHPGFGVSTAWAYKNLARFPKALHGEAGRAQRLAANLRGSLDSARADFYNSLEAPVLEKYPLLALFQEFLKENGALVTLMSGSGSTTFALVKNQSKAEEIQELFRKKFGDFCWLTSVPLVE